MHLLNLYVLSFQKHLPHFHKHKHRDNEGDSVRQELTWGITKPINIDDTPIDNESISYTKTPDNKLRPVMVSSFYFLSLSNVAENQTC